MRLEYSPEKSRCRNDGSSPVLKLAMVGRESSSLTPGSSMVSVAGKKRLPTISWALLPLIGKSASTSPDRTVRARRKDILNSASVDVNRQRPIGRKFHVNGGGARACSGEPPRDVAGSSASPCQTTGVTWRSKVKVAAVCGGSTGAPVCSTPQRAQQPC